MTPTLIPSVSAEKAVKLVLSLKNQIHNSSGGGKSDNDETSKVESSKEITLKTTKEEVAKLKDIMVQFDASIKEIYRLLRTDSMIRFLRTMEYYNFYKQFGSSIINERADGDHDAGAWI